MKDISKGTGAIILTFLLIGILILLKSRQVDSPATSAAPSLVTQSPASSDALVFAGLSGVPPRFIDSGPDKGMGWVEYQTQYVRKGLKADGFQIQQEWMTPARIEHEFRKGSPICTYPARWSHPEELFAKEPDRIYSLALDFESERVLSILVNAKDAERFGKFLDPKGDIILDRLVEDKAFKITLIRDKDYGAVGKKLTRVTEDGEQVVRDRYKSHVALMVARDNRQLIEMLHAGRFDYLFSDSIEDHDLKVSGLKWEEFRRLNYRTSSVKSLTDGSIIQVSVACSKHPISIAAIPLINKWIIRTRNKEWKTRQLYYRRRLDPTPEAMGEDVNWSLLARITSGGMLGPLDEWFQKQARYFPGLREFPEDKPLGVSPPSSPLDKPPALWHVLRSGDTDVVLNESEFYFSSIQELSEGASFGNSNWPYEWSLLSQYLPREFHEKLSEFDFSKEAQGARVAKLLRLRPATTKLILFANGLLPSDIDPLIKQLKSDGLLELSVFDAAPETARKVVSILPNRLSSLNLTNSSLIGSDLAAKLDRLLNLRHLHLNSTQLRPGELSGVISHISPNIESLSLGFQGTAWTPENAKLFGDRKWTKLKRFDLSNSWISTPGLIQILRGLPKGLESLNIQGSNPSSDLRSSLTAQFSKLRELAAMDGVWQSGETQRDWSLPPSLEKLSILGNSIRPRFSGRLSSLLIKGPPGRWDINEAVNHLGSRVSLVDIRQMGVDLSFIKALVARQDIEYVSRLNLPYNNLGDDAVALLCQAKFPIDELGLDGNRIGNRGAELISRCFLNPKGKKPIRVLSLSDNPISEEGVRALAKSLPSSLQRLALGGLLSLDMRSLAEFLPQGLRRLDLGGNQITTPEMELLAPRLPRSLLSLDLSQPALDEGGVVALAKNLPPKLNVLKLRSASLGLNGIKTLAESLPQTLSVLALGQTEVGLDAARSLAKNMPPYLRSLNLESIVWSFQSAKQVLQALPRTVRSVQLRGVPLGTDGALGLSLSLAKNPRDLTLNGAALSNEGVEVLSKTLPPTVEMLQLESNRFEDRGLIALAGQPLEHISYLSLDENFFTAKGYAALGSKARSFRGIELMGVKLDPTSLMALSPNLLENARRIVINSNPLSNSAILALVKRLHPETYVLQASSTGLTYQFAKEFSRTLPRHFSRIVISLRGNSFGKSGRKLLRDEMLRRQAAGEEVTLPGLEDLAEENVGR